MRYTLDIAWQYNDLFANGDWSFPVEMFKLAYDWWAYPAGTSP